jgi:LytS/YehU family sensor histidine kinase
MAMITVLWYQQQQQKEDDQRKADAEKFNRDAELFKLRQQLQPHFLFNSLNSINALITSRPEEAQNMVRQLAEFLRGTLKKEDQWVNLEEEIHHLQLYLEIEKVRFGHRLLTEITCDEPCSKLKLPALLLQPIVENAIKFGLYDTTGTVTIRIHAWRKDDQLMISVQNPFDSETSGSNAGTGFGLSSVQRRLYLLFGRNDLLQTSAAENIFVTAVQSPQQA